MFEFTSKESDNPDLRERGFVYWRLMAIDPNLASQIILSEKPRISEDVSGYDPALLDVLVNNLGTLASIYVKPPELFVKKTKKVNLGEEEEADYEENAFNVNEPEVEEESSRKKDSRHKEEVEEENNEENQANNMETGTMEKPSSGGMNLIDLNDILGGAQSNVQMKQSVATSQDMMNLFESNQNMGNLLDNFSSMSVKVSKPSQIPKQLVLSENTPGFTNKKNGLSIEAALQRENNGGLSLYLTFSNATNVSIQVKYLILNIEYIFVYFRTSKSNSTKTTSA